MPVTRRPLVALALCTLLVALAGCSTPRRPPGPPPLVPPSAPRPTFEIPSLRDRMVFLARQEWQLFGAPSTRDENGRPTRMTFADPSDPRHELQPPMLSRVMMYWYASTRLPIVGHEGELRPWSAAFVTWLARGAGLEPERFPSTVLHWDYIERFLAAPRPGDPFVARDPAAHPPRPGDLVCNVRGGAAADAVFPRLRRGSYHCDVVVATGAGWVDVIGGNLSDVVALVRLPASGDGRLVPQPSRRWAVVLEAQG